MNEQNNGKQGALPFDVTRGFTAVPRAIMLHYFLHPKFNGNTYATYAYLLAFYNAQEGYAFPTQAQASKDLVMSDKTYRTAVNALLAVELIDVKRSSRYGNNTYFFRKPIEDKAEFLARFPEAAERERKQAETIDKVEGPRQAAKVAYEERVNMQRDSENDPNVDEISDWL